MKLMLSMLPQHHSFENNFSLIQKHYWEQYMVLNTFLTNYILSENKNSIEYV